MESQQKIRLNIMKNNEFLELKKLELNHTSILNFETSHVITDIPECITDAIEESLQNLINDFSDILIKTPLILLEDQKTVAIGIADKRYDKNNEYRHKYKITIEKTK